MPGLQHTLALPPVVAPAQPVVDDQQPSHAPRPPPLRPALDDGDGTRRHLHRAIGHAPVAGHLRRHARQLAVDRKRVARGVAPIEALEEHRVLELTAALHVPALERVLRLTRVVDRVHGRADAQHAGRIERDAKAAQQRERERRGRHGSVAGGLELIAAGGQRQHGPAPPRRRERDVGRPAPPIGDGHRGHAHARAVQPERGGRRSVAAQAQHLVAHPVSRRVAKLSRRHPQRCAGHIALVWVSLPRPAARSASSAARAATTVS